VVNAAREAAEEAIAKQSVIELSLADQQRFAVQLIKPKKPNATMKRAAKRRADLVEPS